MPYANTAAMSKHLEEISRAVAPGAHANAGTLLLFRVSGADAEMLASEFDPLPLNELVDQPPYTAWLRRGIGHQRVDLSPRLYPPRGRLELIRRQSRRNFGRSRHQIERSFDL